MYLSSYQTTAGSAFYKTDIVNHLRTARAEKQLTLLLPDVARLYAITQVNANTKTIPAFEHPVRVEESTGDYWVIDLRPYASKIAASNGELPDEGPVRLLVNRTLMEIFWQVVSPLPLQKAGDLATVVYGKWISGLLHVKLHTDPRATQEAQILASLYYMQQFITEEQYTPQLAEAYALKIARIYGLPAKQIVAFLANVNYMAGLGGFCDTLRNKINAGSIALVEPRFMFTMASASWFGGVDSRMLVTTALEYPPVFIAMVIASTRERNYKKTVIAEITQREAGRYKLNDFSVAVESLLRELYRK
jgi:hypothetical protein